MPSPGTQQNAGLAVDLDPEDFEVFLQEADEQLQLLDEDIVRLEREGDNSGLIQEIFRAAHTLKGSSAMIGHKQMAELGHVMESLLDRVRKRTLTVDTRVVDALLRGLDLLRIMKEDLAGLRGITVDITVAVADTGLDTGDPATIHPDFFGRVAFATALCADSADTDGHGTNVAGIITRCGNQQDIHTGGAYGHSPFYL